MKTNELISEIVSLPIDIRASLINKLLESINTTQKEIDEVWAQEAEKRVQDIENGNVKTIPGGKVFENLKKKFNL